MNFRTSESPQTDAVTGSVSSGIETEPLPNSVNRDGSMISIIKDFHSLPVIVEEAYPGFLNFYDPFQGPRLVCSFLPPPLTFITPHNFPNPHQNCIHDHS
jgi:hypothetical protein